MTESRIMNCLRCSGGRGWFGDLLRALRRSDTCDPRPGGTMIGLAGQVVQAVKDGS